MRFHLIGATAGTVSLFKIDLEKVEKWDMAKLGIDSLAELARLAEKAGIEPVHETNTSE
jgi:hypothetical protein